MLSVYRLFDTVHSAQVPVHNNTLLSRISKAFCAIAKAATRVRTRYQLPDRWDHLKEEDRYRRPDCTELCKPADDTFAWFGKGGVWERQWIEAETLGCAEQ